MDVDVMTTFVNYDGDAYSIIQKVRNMMADKIMVTVSQALKDFRNCRLSDWDSVESYERFVTGLLKVLERYGCELSWEEILDTIRNSLPKKYGIVFWRWDRNRHHGELVDLFSDIKMAKLMFDSQYAYGARRYDFVL